MKLSEKLATIRTRAKAAKKRYRKRIRQIAGRRGRLNGRKYHRSDKRTKKVSPTVSANPPEDGRVDRIDGEGATEIAETPTGSPGGEGR